MAHETHDKHIKLESAIMPKLCNEEEEEEERSLANDMNDNYLHPQRVARELQVRMTFRVKYV